MTNAALKKVFFVSIVMFASAANAEQSLMPTPYPQQLGPNAQHIETGRSSYHEHLRDDPSPQAYGPYAQGNPHTHHLRHHQHLIPTPYPRLGW